MLNIILDELKEVKYFKEITDFKKSLQKAQAYLKPKQAYMMELSYEYTYQLYFCNKSSILDARLGYVQASEKIEIFKVKLRWSKSSRLLQRIAFSCFLLNQDWLKVKFNFINSLFLIFKECLHFQSENSVCNYKWIALKDQNFFNLCMLKLKDKV